MDDDTITSILNNTYCQIVMHHKSIENQINDEPLLNEKQDSCHNSTYASKTYNMESGTDYVNEYRQKEDEEYLTLKNANIFQRNDHEENMSEITSCADAAEYKKNTSQIYQMYNFAYRPNIDLPILALKDKIVSMISSNSVIVIHGSTGCGKTTQVPQLILDANFLNQQYCNIIVTQPRRIAALSIAKRVSQERGWPVGTVVGYEMGLIKNICRDTRITYCTTGVLLQKFINRKHMMDYTHVILDEVHERDEDMDFLLLVVRKLLRTNSGMVKVILMSATIDVDKFAKYFSTPVENELLPSPIINIPRSSLYNVSIYYIDEMTNLGTIPEISKDEPQFTSAMAKFCTRIIHIFDRVDSESDGTLHERPTVLVFLPGLLEIEEMHATLLSENQTVTKWEIIILHSLISTEDQENIFKKPSKNFRRIILSTNIAESSITVPNVKYVIDFCLTKLLVTASGSNCRRLQLCWASKSNCQQRAGRTGRVMDGRVYRMVSKSFYNAVLRDEAIPEMIRIPLTNVVLKTKILNMGEPKAILALSLDPPDLSNLRNTILLLKEAGALFNRENEMKEFDGDLTPLGRVMAALPLSIYASKLIVLGHLFDVLHDAIIIAASMCVKDVFNIEFKKLNSTYQEKLYWAANSNSDNIAYLNAFKVWRNDKMNRNITDTYTEKKWAQEKHLRVKSLREIDALIADITQKLLAFDIKKNTNKQPWEKFSINRTFIIKFIIAGAFYPNYFIKNSKKPVNYKKETMPCSYDSMNTVVLHGWPQNQYNLGSIYSRRFQEIFGHHLRLKDPEDITVVFDMNCVYVQYEKKNRTPDDCSFIQDCIKIRQCRNPIIIDLLNERDARDRAEKLGLTGTNSDNKKPYPKLPKQSEYQSKVILQGPFSPLEIELSTINRRQKVLVETASVNSVLLDTYPDDQTGLFLVAQEVYQHSNWSLLLRNTTLLPNTPGLMSLIILIFTPYMELRRNCLGTYYTGALCGLGYDRSTGKSLFAEHDLEIKFNTEITMNDLQMINKLRHWMNVAMHFNDGDNIDNDTKNKLTINCQNQIKNAFKEMIYKIRKEQKSDLTTHFSQQNFDTWNLYDENAFLEPARETSKKSQIYGLHKALELNRGNDELEKIIKHLLELETLAHRKPYETENSETVFCILCSIEICGIINLRIHLCSEQHILKVQMIDISAFGDDLQNIMSKMKL